MEKIRLKKGQEFRLATMGINNIGENRLFKIISDLDYTQTLLQFTDMENIKAIDHILADDSTYATYMDCVGFKSISFVPNIIQEDSETENIYVVELSVNAVERTLRDMQVKIVKLEKENVTLKAENEALKEEKLSSELDTDYRLSVLELGL